MTTPTLFTTQYGSGVESLRQAPGGQGFQANYAYTNILVPASTAQNTVIGILPFQEGFRMSYASKLILDDLDTGTDVTLDWGYVYLNDSDFTEASDAFISSSTIPQGGGTVDPTRFDGSRFIAETEGWVCVVVTGGATTTEGNVTAHTHFDYDDRG